MSLPDSHHSDAESSISESEFEIESQHSEIDELSAAAKTPMGHWQRLGFFLLNLWLVFHLFAVIVCPASVDPSSPVLQAGFEMVAPYLHFIYLDHGFHFFAPEPGPSTLVEYTLEFADGSKKKGRIPDRSISPRLWYHRHFMLTEFLGNGPEELQPLVERAIARNLCRQTGAFRVSLTKLEHHVPSLEDIHRGQTLTDPSFYKASPLGVYTSDELKRPIKLENNGPDSSGAPAVTGRIAEPSKDSQ